MTANRSLTLWVPELLHPQRIEEAQEALQSLKLPALQKLLSKADYHFGKPQSFEAKASYLFHQPQTLPSAATRAAVLAKDAFEQGAEGFWLSVDPVQMIPDRDTLVLIPGSDLGISEEESRQLLQAFNEHYAQDQVELIFGAADQWFMHIKQPIDLQSTSLKQVSYQSLANAYPQGNAANYWRQLINETQMLFYSHPVNEARREKGLPEINSIWPWGEGSINQKSIKLREKACIFAQHPYLLGMAKLTRSSSHNEINTLADWSTKAQTGHSLVYLDTLSDAVPNMQLDEWLQALEQFEQNWAQPLLEALRTKQLDSLLLDLGANKQFYLTANALKRFWRLKKSWRVLAS